LPFLYAFGGGMFDRHNNIAVDSAGSIKGLQFLRNLEDNTGQAGPLTVDFSNGLNNMVNDFMDDKTAMIFDGPWDVSKILSGSGFKSNPGNLGIAPIPMCASGPTCPARQAVSPVGGQSYVISAGTAHPYEAYKFISFMSSKDSQVAIAKANHTLPTLSSAYSKVSSDRFISEFHYIWEREAVARPAIPQGGYLFDAFDRSIWAVLVGVQDPQDALKAVFDSWKQIGVGG
jgi:arabinogalactan oligomer/maltooligosaccharide transport system substrate-binding protein